MRKYYYVLLVLTDVSENRIILKLNHLIHRTAIKKAGKAVMMSVKRESGNIIDSVKQNSALKSAFRSVS